MVPDFPWDLDDIGHPDYRELVLQWLEEQGREDEANLIRHYDKDVIRLFDVQINGKRFAGLGIEAAPQVVRNAAYEEIQKMRQVHEDLAKSIDDKIEEWAEDNEKELDSDPALYFGKMKELDKQVEIAKEWVENAEKQYNILRGETNNEYGSDGGG